MTHETPQSTRADSPQLMAGAARTDITPSDLKALNPIGGGDFEGVHDRLFLRALVLDDGLTRLVLVATDLIEVGDMAPVRRRIEAELGVPTAQVLITASHTHSAPRLGRVSPGALAHDGGEESRLYSERVYDVMVEAVGSAIASLRPARMAHGAGHADVNVNRDCYVNGKWTLGFNADGPSDKAVNVVAFFDDDDSVIGLIMNYPVHSVVTLGSKQISGDLAGAAAARVERILGGSAVALWTLSSVGDQNPRIQLGFPGEFTSDQVDAAWAASDAQGLVVGAEVVRVVQGLRGREGSLRFRAVERVLAMPVKRGVDVMDTMKQADVSTVDLRLIAFGLGSIAIAGVNGEVTTTVAQRLKRSSPSSTTVLISMANDRIGYLPDDESFVRGTFEANGSPIAQGHAESAIVGDLSDMVRSVMLGPA